ncbi:FAD-dependent oxidoreductase [Longispora albida]|uniref:FAD-dependent oxidoreductase n=1 Tax=Longispora albida TaxID=203523 RepID=UPI00039F668F|nr:FAD-dependent oxidoreductase [Longispora albida]
MSEVREVAVVVIGAGQAGLSAAYHLKRMGVDLVVLDANDRAGGAWQHRWDTLTMHDVHGISTLPGMPVPEARDTDRANDLIPRYFASYEAQFGLPILRPVHVTSVREHGDGRLAVESDAGTFAARAIVNATGTWNRPFIPSYPGAETFRGRQIHTAGYHGPAEFAGQHVIVVGGGHSAVQLLAELSDVASTTWVTRRPPLWRDPDSKFGPEQGRAAVAMVAERVKAGLPPQSVVSVTGLHLREQERAAAARGVYERLPMFTEITPEGVRWADGSTSRADAILWATGFRPDVAHLAPLHLREHSGGIALDGTRALRDPRVHLVGYGPSASTIGGNRAGYAAARELRAYLQPVTA